MKWFLILLLLITGTFANEKQNTSKEKYSAKCLNSLDSIYRTLPMTAYTARITYAEARSRALQLEDFEKEMPKSDLLPYFSKACDFYIELISLYAAKENYDSDCKKNKQEQFKIAEEIEKTLADIVNAKTGKLASLSKDLAEAKNEVAETTEEAKKREEELQAQAKAREDELTKALEEERKKAEERQQEAKNKLNKLQSRLIQVTEDARGIILSMSDILFDVNKATLKSDLKTSLAKVAGILSVYQELNVSIEGHTDNTGSEAHNLKLSEQRAENVLEFLVSQGIEKSRLNATGFGMSKPVGDNATKEGRQKNRRVDLVIQDKMLQGK